MRERVTVVDGDDVGDSVPRVDDDTGLKTCMAGRRGGGGSGQIQFRLRLRFLAMWEVGYDRGGLTLSVQGEYGLDGHVDSPKTVLFEHDLAHPQPITLRVHRGFGQEDLSPLGVDL